MEPALTAATLYLPPLLGIWAWYAVKRMRRSRQGSFLLAAARNDGMMEPASLHPKINPLLCLGCGTCVKACPEKNVMGMVAGKAVLVTPANCIGHGACKDACPIDAITLVLGTEKRGVDIPVLSPRFETNVPGIFVAGELGGMGLIRNGIEQGRQVIDSIRALDGMGTGDRFDVVIIGAGPAGFSATLAAKKHGLRYWSIEQESLGGTVAHYPRGKIVMTAPVDLPIYGKVQLHETTKEALLELWTRVAREAEIEIRYHERVEAIEAQPEGDFLLRSTAGEVRTRSVLLAIGRRGTPRKLDVPGEDLHKVVYRLIDAEQYRGQDVLVVGGGDSALEAAVSLSQIPGTTVLLSYRSDSFSRAKRTNRDAVDTAVKEDRLQVEMASTVLEIADDTVRLQTSAGERSFRNDAVIICAGGILPARFLESIGVQIVTKHGEA